MERGVEDGDVGDAGQRGAGTANRVERRTVVERRQHAHPLDLGLHVRVEPARALQAGAAVHHAMPDRLCGLEPVDRLRPVAPDQV